MAGVDIGLIWDEFSSSLSRFLDLSDSSDIIQYLRSIENDNDVEDYLCGLLDKNDPDHRQFITTFMSKWKNGGKHIPLSVPANAHTYKKADYKEESTGARRRSKEKGVSSELCRVDQTVESPEVGKESGSKTSKKKKFVPLYSEEGRAKSIIQLAGRHKCDCQAAKHKLINNCLSCGRIVCEQEDSGPCLFCGKLVCTNEEQEIIDRNSKTSAQLYKKLMGGLGAPKDTSLTENKRFQVAVEHKNKLLEYDRTVERRTKVIDDQSDYFTSDNRWLSKEERDAVKKREDDIDAKKKASRKTTKVTFDFAGRQVLEEKENFDYKTEDEIQADIQNYINRSASDSSGGLNPMAADLPRPVYVSNALPAKKHHRIISSDDNKNKSRLQDRELQEMSDAGWALSLHQPYASLLISGIKMHEGRVWYSALRGRLWIASTAREFAQAEIQQIENSLRILSGRDNVVFPTVYPAGALLGCVDVIDCLPQEEYRKKYPDGESESPYVFICENPQELIVKFPVKGKHKIYKLDSRIHDAAKKTIKRSPV